MIKVPHGPPRQVFSLMFDVCTISLNDISHSPLPVAAAEPYMIYIYGDILDSARVLGLHPVKVRS